MDSKLVDRAIRLQATGEADAIVTQLLCEDAVEVLRAASSNGPVAAFVKAALLNCTRPLRAAERYGALEDANDNAVDPNTDRI